MKQESPLNQPKRDERERSDELIKAPESKEENGPPRALGNQTGLGDQTELNVGGDQPTLEPVERGQEHNEELAHSNSSSDHHTTHKTKAGERDPSGLHGG